MQDTYREKIVKENMALCKQAYCGPRPGFNVGGYYADCFSKCWIAVEAYIKSEFNGKRIEARKSEFILNFKTFYSDKYHTNFSTKFKESINKLSKYSVKDQDNLSRPAIYITQKDDLKSVIDITYRVYCNFKHGGKLMAEEENITLVENSFYVIYEIFDTILREEGIVQ